MSSRPLLEVDHLTIAFGDGPARQEVVRDLSFTLGADETLGLVGESGSGKSMTALAIMGLLPEGAQETGSIRFQGDELTGRSDGEMRKIRGDRIAMVFQDPLSSLNPYYTVGLQIAETYRAHRGGSGRAAHQVAVEALRRVHIQDAEHRVDYYPHQFSGGMRQRVMIAMALCLEPELIIADEPTTALDVTVQAHILELLREVQSSVKAALIFISHNLAVVSQMADTMLVMQNGDPMEAGPVRQVFTAPTTLYTQQLLDAIPRIDDRLEPEETPECPHSDATAAVLASECGHSGVLLRARGLTRQFPGARSGWGRRGAPFTAVDEVSFELAPNETLAIVGESGSGKSTTARMVAKLLEPTAGTLTFEDRDVTHLKGAELEHFRRDVQVVFQDPFSSLNPRHTAGSIIAAPARYQRVGSGADQRRQVRELMERVGLNPDHADRFPWQFSGGQAQRIGIARALALHPKLVICDEAVSALDVSVQARILELLADLQREFRLSYLFIAHDLAVVRHIADRVAVMSQGRIVESGTRDQVFDHPQHEYTRSLLAAVPKIPAEWDAERRADPSRFASQV